MVEDVYQIAKKAGIFSASFYGGVGFAGNIAMVFYSYYSYSSSSSSSSSFSSSSSSSSSYYFLPFFSPNHTHSSQYWHMVVTRSLTGS